MKLILSLLFGLLFLFVELPAKSEQYVQPLTDTVNIKVIEIPKDVKPFYEKPWFPTLLGSLLGSGLAFAVTYRMYYLTNKRSDRLRKEQEQKEKLEIIKKDKKDVLFQLKDCRAEIAAYSIKLRATANAIFHLEYEYYYEALRAMQTPEFKEQDKINLNKKNAIEVRVKKREFDFLAADLIKWSHFFLRYMQPEEVITYRVYITDMVETDFKYFDYIYNEKMNHREYDNAAEGIDLNLVNVRLMTKSVVPLSNLLTEIIKRLESEIN